MKAQINVSITMNVNVSSYNGWTLISYQDGPFKVFGLGENFWDALNNFRIQYTAKVHSIRWAAGWRDADIMYSSSEPRTALSGFPAHQEWGAPLKSHRRL